MAFPRLFIPALVAVLVSVPAHADINIHIGVPPPPTISVSAPPVMVWLPGPSIYVAHESSHPIFFLNDWYYLNDGGHWYAGPGYAGPWKHVKGRQVPPGLRKFRRGDWHGYQREARKHRHKGRTFHAKHDKPGKGRNYRDGGGRGGADRGRGDKRGDHRHGGGHGR